MRGERLMYVRGRGVKREYIRVPCKFGEVLGRWMRWDGRRQNRALQRKGRFSQADERDVQQ